MAGAGGITQVVEKLETGAQSCLSSMHKRSSPIPGQESQTDDVTRSWASGADRPAGLGAGHCSYYSPVSHDEPPIEDACRQALGLAPRSRVTYRPLSGSFTL